LASSHTAFQTSGSNPVEAVQNDRQELVLLGLQRPKLLEEFGEGLGLWESGDIELLSAFLGTDKYWLRRVRRPKRLSNAIDAVDEGEDALRAFAA
jgi:hypothetical protein